MKKYLPPYIFLLLVCFFWSHFIVSYYQIRDICGENKVSEPTCQNDSFPVVKLKTDCFNHISWSSVSQATQSQNFCHLNRNSLTWSRLDISKSNISCLSLHKFKTRNKIIDMYESGKDYKVISKALGFKVNHYENHYPKWRTMGQMWHVLGVNSRPKCLQESFNSSSWGSQRPQINV